MPSVTVVSVSQAYRENLHDLGYKDHSEWNESQRIWGETCIDEMHEYAGRTCYLSYNRPNKKTATNKGYLANIIEQGHFSVFSHSHLSLVVDCSRSCSHEIARHIFLGKSETSQRYIDPLKILNITGEDEERFKDHLVRYSEVFEREMKETGGKVKASRGVARQELPLGFPTRLVLSGNYRAWRDFLWQRLSPTADKEIREVAFRVFDVVQLYGPNSVQDLTKEYGNELEDYRSGWNDPGDD